MSRAAAQWLPHDACAPCYACGRRERTRLLPVPHPVDGDTIMRDVCVDCFSELWPLDGIANDDTNEYLH